MSLFISLAQTDNYIIPGSTLGDVIISTSSNSQQSIHFGASNQSPWISLTTINDIGVGDGIGIENGIGMIGDVGIGIGTTNPEGQLHVNGIITTCNLQVTGAVIYPPLHPAI